MELSEPDSSWAEQFESIRSEVLDVLGALARSIEHIGSTAVPGLLAKPTIDVLVVVDDTDDVLRRIEALAALGFVYRPEAWPVPDRCHDGDRTAYVAAKPEYRRGAARSSPTVT